MAVNREHDALRPPRGYSWPPFQSGHEVNLRHGAYHAATVDPVAGALVESLGGVEYIASVPEFAAAVWGWARAEAKVRLVSEYLDREGILDEEGTPRPAADLLVRLERQAADARGRLGLDPLSRARLGKDVAGAQFDLARLWAAEHDAAGAAETAEDGLEPPGQVE
jgi:hypothetical protein